MTIKPEEPSNVTPLPTKDMADGATYGDLKELLRLTRCALLDANEEIMDLKKCVEFWHKQFSDKCGTQEQAMEEMAQTAPALTADLKLELLDALNAGLEWTAPECCDKSLAMECEQDHNKIRAAITKLTNLECGS